MIRLVRLIRATDCFTNNAVPPGHGQKITVRSRTVSYDCG